MKSTQLSKRIIKYGNIEVKYLNCNFHHILEIRVLNSNNLHFSPQTLTPKLTFNIKRTLFNIVFYDQLNILTSICCRIAKTNGDFKLYTLILNYTIIKELHINVI